jgi:hypothetical protein
MRWGRLLLVVGALLVINVPYALHARALHRAETDGVPVTAAVTSVIASGNDLRVDFRLPRDVDAKQTQRTVLVDRPTGLAAQRTHELEVRVLKGHPGAFYVDGQVRSRTALFLTLVADAVVLLMLVLSWRLGGRLRRPTLVGVAVEDVRRGQEGSLLDKQDDGTHLVNGEVAESGPTTVVLRLRDRDVEIHLRDHTNDIAVGERAVVRAQLVG